MNKIFRNKLILRIRNAIAEASQAKLLEHPGMTGNVREIVTASLIQPLMSPNFSIGTGKITDCRGNLSNETDIIIYSPLLLPPIFYDDGKLGVFPVESCLRSIEIKSTLTASELRSAVESARNIQTGFVHLQGKFDENGKSVLHSARKVGRMLFAFGTDLEQKDEFSRYKEADPKWESAPAIRAFCVVGRGTWLWSTGNKWFDIKPTAEHEEVIEFLLACVGRLQMDFSTRHEPPLDAYLSPRVTLEAIHEQLKKAGIDLPPETPTEIALEKLKESKLIPNRR